MAGKGIQHLPLRIPAQWDPVWFQDFVRDVLSKMDARNALDGLGISVTGNSNEPATIAASEDIHNLFDADFAMAEANALLPNARTLEGQPGVVSVTDAGPGGALTVGIQGGGIGPDQIAQFSALSILGNPTNATAPSNFIAAGTDDTFLARVAGALGFSSLTLPMVADALLTYAKLQNVSATARVLGRKTAGAGVVEECSLSDVLDLIGSAAQGDILYRDASGWARLPAGSSGQFLKTNGSGANPAWDSGGGGGGALSYVGAATVSGAAATSLSISGLDLDADGEYQVRVSLKNATATGANVSLTYNADTTATNYDRQSNNGNSGLSGARGNDPNVFNLPASSGHDVTAHMRIYRTLGGQAKCISMAIDGDGTIIISQFYVHSWRTTGTNVTGFTLTSATASALAIGSYIKVWKIT